MGDAPRDHEYGATRRAFLENGARIGASGALSVTGAVGLADGTLAQPTRETRRSVFETPGRPSRSAYRALAVIERRAEKRSNPTFERVVDATEYLDLGPNDPVNEALERADSAGDLDGVRLDFSPGTYALDGDCRLSPDGAFGMVGPRATFRLDPGVRCELNLDGVAYGLLDGLTFDQRAQNAAISLGVLTAGHISVRGLTYHGAVEALEDDQSALLRPVATNREASVRIDDFHATGGTNAGSHAWVGSGSPPKGFIAGGVPGAFVGPANEGTVQFVNSRLRGWENGLYASRTPGAVQVVGGTFINNNNTGVRISGAESFCDGATVVLDARRWPMDQPGAFTIGEIQGVSAVRTETGDLGKRGARLANMEVRAYDMDNCPGLVIYRGSAGAGRMNRCRLRNHIDGTPAVLIAPPGSGSRDATSGAQAVEMSHIEISGTATGAPAVRGSDQRPNSSLADSCIDLPDAGPERVVGVETKNVGYGAGCDASQLIDGPVGIPSNVPEIRDARVPPPSPGSGLLGVGFVLALGSTVAFVLATLVPAVLAWLRDRLPGA